MSTAASKSPLASVSAFLQSIMPAPVIWRSLFTSAAVIAIAFFGYRFLNRAAKVGKRIGKNKAFPDSPL
jgi:hypothetical protein